MSILNDFKKFAMRGNVVDLAVGVVIGGAFGKIVGSLVDQVIMPPIGLLTGGVDFSAWAIQLKPAGPDGKGEVAIHIGAFINTIVQFLIVAFAIFMVVKVISALEKKKEVAPPPTKTETLLAEIRDLLQKPQ